ncbi:hypothetical protein HMN09_01357200 [Mycena chlorophos]|uniref:Uncharacterized protein n=1 Tax=Mycena chlorophos TaxID=658473 RepID=A0A8H6S0K8_MYCCL|nr:hypothetical protein HMN09_01357200 [Mycena chlorophos]
MTTITRRLSSRRGSTTASDPFARNAHLNRESSSILTIVRVTSSSPAGPPPGPLETPPSPRRAHRRLGSNPNAQQASQDSPPAGRVSFAFSSFAAPSQQAQNHQQANSSSGGSPRLRPSSPHRTPSAPSFTNTRLTPEQVLEVAKQATNPRPPASPSIPALHSQPTLPPRSGSPSKPEVSALLSSPPSAKLFALLAQTFPKNAVKRADDQLPVNTAEWTFDDLSYWLTKTTREEASDAFWVQTARTCILKHSELIWERLRGALGVPPELDIDVKETEYQDVFEEDEEEIPEDHGRKAFGHWEDWDAVLDSPIFDRHSAASSPNASRRASGVPQALSGTATPTIFTQLPTPHDSEYFSVSPIGLTPSNGSDVIIEPVLAVSDAFLANTNPPPMSLPASMSGDNNGLGDIGEEDEEEDNLANKTIDAEPELPEYPQVLGLRISTPGAPVLLPSSPSLRSATTGGPLRSPSFSSRGPNSPALVRSNSSSSHASGGETLTRTGSSGSISAMNNLARRGSFGSMHSFGSDRDAPYDPVADRSPGNPIFPSNFARLAVGPTLAANNPSLRSPTLPPQFKHGLGMRRSSSTRSDRGSRFRRSWGIGVDDYAITVASGSSAGGSVRDGD